MSELHPCPWPGSAPHKAPKGWREGALWACECGKVYRLRNDWNYAGDWWVWEPFALGGDES